MRRLACLILVVWTGAVTAFELLPGFSVQSVSFSSSITFPIWPNQNANDCRNLSLSLVHPVSIEINGTPRALLGLNRATWENATTDSGESLLMPQGNELNTQRTTWGHSRRIGNQHVTEQIPNLQLHVGLKAPLKTCTRMDLAGTVVARRAKKESKTAILVMGSKEAVAGAAVTFPTITDAAMTIDKIENGQFLLRMPEATFQRLEDLTAKNPNQQGACSSFWPQNRQNGYVTVCNGMNLQPQGTLTISLCPEIEEVEIPVQINDIPLPLPGVPLQMPVKTP